MTSLKFSSLAMMVLRGTNTAVGSTAPSANVVRASVEFFTTERDSGAG